jgi:hypothetical protein
VHNERVKTASAFLIAAFVALSPAAASAQLPVTPPTDPPPTTPTPPPTTPAPAPAAGKGSIAIASGLSDGGRQYVAAGQRIRLAGSVKPAVAGQKIIVELFRGSKQVDRKIATVSKTGGFSLVFRVSKAGTYIVKARHKASAEQQRFTIKRKSFEAMRGGVGSGSGAKKIHLVQRGLARLAYVTSQGGHFDGSTARAVLAFRKTNGLGRNSSVSAKVFEMLLSGHGGFKLKYPKAGKHVEFDWSRQVLVLARGGKAERIYHASSGKPSTPTVFGTFRFYRKQPGTNSHGMVFSTYFIRGYAIHGYKDVPNYAASHGCIRVPIPNAVSIYQWLSLGDQIFVYR